MRKSKLEVQLNRDIREYKSKLIWGLTGRQTAFSAAGLAAGVALYFLASPLGSNAAAICCTLGAAIFIALGFVKWKGLPIETFIKIWIRGNIMTPQFLPYRPEEPECLKKLHMPEKNRKGKRKNEKSN